ncbi:MAG TPA: 4'-phosphopantetheinyl transferase superfamily protein [Terrimicrobiaceae bacterium]
MDPFLVTQWSDYEEEDLEVSAGAADLWLIRPSHNFIRYLNSAERLRYEKMMNEEVRVSYSSAQGGLRRIVGCYMRSRPADVTIYRGRRGKPYVPGAPEFNLSNTSGRTIAAFSLRPVGIDVESASRRVNAEAVAKKFFFEEEQETIRQINRVDKNLTFLRYWVCKEAMVKLSGDGIYHGLRHARVELGVDKRSHGQYRGRMVWLKEFRPAPDLLAALASWEPLEAKRFLRI